MSKSPLDSLLAELYAIDPELQTREQELIPLLQTLLEHQPDATPSKAFVARLRSELKAKARAMETEHAGVSRSFFSVFSGFKFSYAVLGVVLGAIITAPTVYYALHSPGSPGSMAQHTDAKPLFAYSIIKRPQNAFGDLSTISLQPSGRGGGGGGLGGDSATAAPSTGKMMAPAGSGGGATSDLMPYPQEITQYEYSFSGSLPPLTSPTVPVLKREKSSARIDLGAIAGNFDLGALNIRSFPGARVDNLTFTQDTQYGYMVNVQLAEGMVSINQNYAQWPQPTANCKDEACYRAQQVKINEILPDATVIHLASAFAKEHNFDMSHYGEPEVDNSWKTDYERTPDKSSYYIPDVQRVTYPLLIDGKPVYDEGGGKAGIQIGVSVREKKVTDAWGLMNQNYLRSDYAAVQGSGSILNFLKNFEQTPKEFMSKDAKVRSVKIELGEPTLGYTRMYNYTNMQSDELVVPALIFPVAHVPNGDYYYRKFIAVPLAKELFDRMQNQGRPMPL
ncbi:MAG: hypothetical protein JWM56_657 [Candidatus Peribacteria bacterium]|nr:hypothetical protein [Candidatus Peribacteria bacterium]